MADLVIANGHVVDPGSGVDRQADVLIANGVVEAVADAGSGGLGGADVVDASGCLVVPGLVDIHTHIYYGVTSICVDPRTALLKDGVTAVADAGTAGSSNFRNFREFIVPSTPAATYAWLNIVGAGLVNSKYLRASRVDQCEPATAVKLCRANRDTIVGIKVQLPGPHHGPLDEAVELLEIGAAAASEAGVPMIVHFDGGISLGDLFSRLRPGDIVTHCFQANPPVIAGASGPDPLTLEARQRGVLFDAAPAGRNHLGWDVVEACAAHGFWPDIIASDLATTPRDAAPGFMRTLPEVISAFLDVGMPLVDVVRASTTAAASAIGRDDLHGSLAPGRSADVAVLRRVERDDDYADMTGRSRVVHAWLEPVMTVRAGRTLWAGKASGG